MAKLVTKFKYLKPGARQGRGGYAKYIATRDGVDKIDDTKRFASATWNQKQLITKILRDFPDSKDMLEYEDYQQKQTVESASEFISRAIEDNAAVALNAKTYADYIATRPRAERFGSHGLFTDDGVQVNLKKVSQELNNYGGNVWTVIISLRREDAERLGFDNGSRWRDMLRTQTQELSENLRIPLGHLKWFAAFHNESHHPHVHLIAYSTEEKEGYLTKQGVQKLRSAFAKDIFAQDLLCIHEKQTEHRDRLRSTSKDVLTEIVSRINDGGYSNPHLEELLVQLSQRLSRTKGKKVYGYLKADVKALVDSIVDELAIDERIAALYDLWYQQRENVLRTYNSNLPERVSLSQNKEFKSIKNAVIQEALQINIERQMTERAEEDITVPDMPDSVSQDFDSEYGSTDERNTWWTERYKQARTFLYGTMDAPPDFDQALALMQAEAATGNGFAMHDLGRMYLSGLGCDKDESLAQEWFQKAYPAFLDEESTAKKKDYLQYRIGKLFAFGYGVEQDYSQAADWYDQAVEAGNPFAAYALSSLHRHGQGVPQDGAEAFQLFEMAASDGKKPNAYAAYELGKMRRDGIGAPKDESAAGKWFAQAYNGFLAIEKNMADDKLYYRLGQMNLTGTGTKVDVHLAKHYFEKAAQLDNLDAMYGLGKLLLQKDSISYAPEKAVKYLTVAAERGHESAQYLLGKTYLKGEDVPQDLERGADFLKRTADRGNQFAQYTLGKALLEQPLPVQADPIQLLTASADQGFAPTCYLLGKIYLYGTGVAPDRDKAVSYLTIAADQGNQYATRLLEKMNSVPNYHSPVATNTLRLLQQVGQIIQNEIQPIYLHNNVDRKLRRKINEKKQAQGLRQG